MTKFLLLGVLCLGFILFWFNPLSLETLVLSYNAVLEATQQRFWLTLTLYILIYCVVSACALPLAAYLTVAGGALFGTWIGAIGTVLGATLGACILFYAVKIAFYDLFHKRQTVWIQRFENGFKRNAFHYMLFLRLIPLFPFAAVNIVPALLGVPFPIYAIATLIGITPATILYTSIGNAVTSLLAAGQIPDLSSFITLDVLLPLIGLAFLVLLPVAYRAFKSKNDDV